MKFVADMHMHTIASTHAYSTMEEMLSAAARKGFFAAAITDHGVAMPGAPGTWYFENMKVLPRVYKGVLVLRGQESNVLDYEGNLDLLPEDAPVMEWIVASMHGPTMMPGRKHSREDITNAWLQVAKNPLVKVIGHCGSEEFSFDYEKVIPEFGRMGKLVELNEGTFRVRKGSLQNCASILKLCKKYEVRILVNSDAHVSTHVGEFSQGEELLKELNFPEELVVNSSKERMMEYLREYTHVLEDPAYREAETGGLI